MREYFDHAYEGLCDSVQQVVGNMAELFIIALIYLTIPLWVVPYMVYLKIEERNDQK